jgi:acyl carrier protein
MTPADRARELIVQYLMDAADAAPDRITDDSALSDLGADDLDALEIVMLLEDAFGCEFDDAERSSAGSTVGDFITMVDKIANVRAA